MLKKFFLVTVAFMSIFILSEKNVYADAGFAKPHLVGNWYVYINVNQNQANTQEPPVFSIKKSAIVWGVVSIAKDGTVKPSENGINFYDYENGEYSASITGGKFLINKNGVVKGMIDVSFENGELDSITVYNSKMDISKKMLVGVVKDIGSTDTYGIMSAIKH